MPQTNDQIEQQYNSLPWLSRVATKILDPLSIAGNAISFGGANKLAQVVTGASDQQVADMDHARRVRAGIVGDIANTGGELYGIGKGISLAKGAYGVARALPAAASLVDTAGVGTAAKYALNRAGPGVVPSVAPLTTKAMGKLGLKGLGAATLFGLSMADRSSGTPGPVSAATTPEQFAKPGEGPAPGAAVAGLDEARRPPTAQELLMATLQTRLAQGATMHDLETIGKILPLPPQMKPPTLRDSIESKNYDTASKVFQDQIAGVQAQKAAGKLSDADAQKATAQFLSDYLRNGIAVTGGNPMNYATANLVPQPDEAP